MTSTEERLKPYVYVHDGRRVPWVAQWTGEVNTEPVQPFHLDDGLTIRYADETTLDRDGGILWMRTGVDRDGEPMFAQLNVYRQRDAMIYGLCQVCGLGAGDTWLIAPPDPIRSGSIFTTTPPTCKDCLQVARRQCPQLNKDPVRPNSRHHRIAGQRRGGVLLQVGSYRPYAVWGDIVEMHNGQVRHYQGEIPLIDPRAQRTILTRQLVVEIFDYRKVREDG